MMPSTADLDPCQYWTAAKRDLAAAGLAAYRAASHLGLGAGPFREPGRRDDRTPSALAHNAQQGELSSEGRGDGRRAVSRGVRDEASQERGCRLDRYGRGSGSSGSRRRRLTRDILQARLAAAVLF